jgi:hypothetical protein
MMSTPLQLFAKSFLKRIRDFVSSDKLVIERLPKWVKSARVKIAKLNDSNIFLFEDSSEDNDLFVDCGEVRADLQFFLELPEYVPEGASFKAPIGQGLIVLHGEYGEGKKVIFNITSANSALFNVGYIPYHSPLGIVNIFIQLSTRGDVLAIRFVPFAIYVHDKDLVNFENFWNKCTPHIQDVLRAIHHSETGDYYQLTKERKTGILVGKERSVIVFGKDSDPEMLRELLRARDYLIAKDYDAYLLRDLPEHPSMSLEEKVKLWSLASRFCVMVDREPSGHLVEYPYLKSVGVVLAVLRPKGTGSTYMIGAERSPDIKLFEFINSPLETLDTVITWAEEIIREKIVLYGKAYPWRK